MRKSAVFVPDIRSDSGRSLIVQEKLAHSKRLAMVRPTIDSHQPRKPLSARPSSRSGSRSPSLNHSTTLKSSLSSTASLGYDLSRIKPSVDCKEPSSFHMSSELSAQRQRRIGTMNQAEHERNLSSLQKRIMELDSVAQRKKNPFDPTVHPSMLMRRAWTPAASLSSVVAELQLKEKEKERARPRTAAHGSRSLSSSPGANGRPHTANSHSHSVESPYRDTVPSSDSESPSKTVDGSQSAHQQQQQQQEQSQPHQQQYEEEDAYVVLRDSVVAQIVEERIFHEADLRRLFDHRLAIAVSQDGLDRGRATAVIDSLKIEFEVS
eukprot:ANDGO_01757.mRNA.1 hypothetical protein TTHERM_00283340